MRPADPTEQFRQIVRKRTKLVLERDEPSLCQITALDLSGGDCEISLSPNPQIWTPIVFDFPTTFRLMPGSVVWARPVNPPGDTIAVDVSIRVWPEPQNLTARALRMLGRVLRGK